MPSSISSSATAVAQLVSAIRNQLSANAGALAARPKARPDVLQTSSYRPENLDALIKQRIKQIGRDDQERGKKAFRVFLEAVLLSQLGEQLMHDPKFYQVLDEIQHSMDANPATRSLVEQATAHLLNPG